MDISPAEYREQARLADQQQIERRLYLQLLAQDLGNVSQACRALGMTRTQFYKYRKRLKKYGLLGLRNLPPVHKSHPQTTPPEIVQRVIQLSLLHADWGCSRLSTCLKEQNISISGPTIQRILSKEGMGSKNERSFLLEENVHEAKIVLTEEQSNTIYQNNPCLREKQAESRHPGELLVQDTYTLDLNKGQRIYFHYLVDTYNSYGFGQFSLTNDVDSAIQLLQERVLPFYQQWGVVIRHILTDKHAIYCKSDGQRFDCYLRQHSIGHRLPRLLYEEPNGFLTRFLNTVRTEFFCKSSSDLPGRATKPYQNQFDCWVEHYNHVRPHRGYRNFGLSPFMVLQRYISLKEKAN